MFLQRKHSPPLFSFRSRSSLISQVLHVLLLISLSPVSLFLSPPSPSLSRLHLLIFSYAREYANLPFSLIEMFSRYLRIPANINSAVFEMYGDFGKKYYFCDKKSLFVLNTRQFSKMTPPTLEMHLKMYKIPFDLWKRSRIWRFEHEWNRLENNGGFFWTGRLL